jgi:hypothetical protein
MAATQDEIAKVLSQLEEDQIRIVEMTKDATSARLTARPDAESWSANDILAHLRACSDVWGKSIRAMITQDHPTLRYVSPRTYIRKTKYLEQEFHPSLEAFVKQREELLVLLKSLPPEGWARGATFTGTTRGRNQTVFSYAQRIVDHEMPHVDEIGLLLNSVQTGSQL